MVLVTCAPPADRAAVEDNVVEATDGADRDAADSARTPGAALEAQEPDLPTPLDAEDPFAAFGFSSRSVADTTTRRIAVRVVNRGVGRLIVRADGGAGSVILDTLEAADSARVRLETRADSVRLFATDVTGVEVGSWWLRPDSLEVRAAFPH